jgi:hypothetical protein
LRPIRRPAAWKRNKVEEQSMEGTSGARREKRRKDPAHLQSIFLHL